MVDYGRLRKHHRYTNSIKRIGVYSILIAAMLVSALPPSVSVSAASVFAQQDVPQSG